MLKPNWLTRPLNENDSGVFKEIRLVAIADSPSTVWPTAEEEEMRTSAEVQAKLQQTASQVVFGTFFDGQLIAIAGLRRESLVQVAHKALVWGVFVRQEFRKEGIARHLFECIKQYADKTGVLQIHLSVNSENQRAKNLYESLGFRKFATEPRSMRIGKRFYDEEHMCLRLDE
ncbi:GNAT family N-acetyltransferase [Rugamonas sp. CCM 8940]|nr:GNAT family N-acetyltransferase [Rugamonas sp. CCM 8940]